MSSVGNAFTEYQKAKADSQIDFFKFTIVLISILYIISFLLAFTSFKTGTPLDNGDLIPGVIRVPLLIIFIIANALLIKSSKILNNINENSSKQQIESAVKESDKYQLYGYVLNIMCICASTYFMFF